MSETSGGSWFSLNEDRMKQLQIESAWNLHEADMELLEAQAQNDFPYPIEISDDGTCTTNNGSVILGTLY